MDERVDRLIGEPELRGGLARADEPTIGERDLGRAWPHPSTSPTSVASPALGYPRTLWVIIAEGAGYRVWRYASVPARAREEPPRGLGEVPTVEAAVELILLDAYPRRLARLVWRHVRDQLTHERLDTTGGRLLVPKQQLAAWVRAVLAGEGA